MLTHATNERRQLTYTIATLLIVFALVLVEKAHAQTNAQLDLSPERCIALNEGQTCYQTVTVTWQSEQAGDYCLMSENTELPLACWKNSREGKAKMEFASSETVTFRLRLTSANLIQTVAQSDVIVTWVYSDTKRRRNSWRLF